MEQQSLRDKLNIYKYEFGVSKKIPCSSQQNQLYAGMLRAGQALPEGVYAFRNGTTTATDFYTFSETDLTQEEIDEYLLYKKLTMIRTIKNCAVFISVLVFISVVAGLVLWLSGM